MHKKLFLLLGFLSLALVGIFALKADVVAQTTSYSLSGYAWSPNVGWISFKSPTGLYGVKINKTPDLSAHPLTGYAWSSNVGWVSFNYVELPNACKVGPTINMTTGVVTGNAVVLAGKDRTDGWDGCIDLTGVRMDPTTGVFSGYAWGGEVVGWIEVSPYLVCDDCVQVAAFSGTCNASLLDLTSAQQDVEFWFYPSNGTGPYNTTINFGDGTTESTFDEAYIYSYERFPNGVTYNPTAVITDSTGKTANVSCGPVTIPGTNPTQPPPPPPPPPTETSNNPALKMVIGSADKVTAHPSNDYTDCPDLSCANKKYSIRQGKPFSLKINHANITASCSLYSNKSIPNFNRSISGPTTFTHTDTAGAATGRHTITVKCETTPSALQSTVQLDISSASIIEI